MLRIFSSLIMLVVGYLFVRNSYKATKAFGYIDFAEKWFGSGGTYTFFKVLGVALIFLGFLTITHLIDIFGRVFAGMFVPAF